jgi:hypothetical protein
MRKLYLFTNTKGNGFTGWENCLAISDSGRVLAQHLCSNVTFMYGDLYGDRPERKEMWEKEFGGKEGEAFEVICLKPGDTPPEEIFIKNQKLAEECNNTTP